MKTQREMKLEPGLVLSCMLMMALIHTQIFNLSGIYTAYVADDLGIPRFSFSIHITISMLVCIFVSAFIGRIFDRGKVKRVLLFSAVAAGVCQFLYSFSDRIWQFYIISFFLGCSAVTLGSTGVSLIIHAAVPEERQGTALGIAMAGSSLGGVVFSPVISAISEALSWRWAYRLVGGVILAVLLPMIAANITEDIFEIRKTEKTAVERNTGIRKETMLPSLFFMLVSGFDLIVLNNICVTYYGDLGMAPEAAAVMFSLMFMCMAAGKLALGPICDHQGHRFGLLTAMLLELVGYVLALFVPQAHWLGYLVAVVFGLGNAVATVGLPLYISDMFGYQEYDRVAGPLFSAFYLGNALAPMIAAAIFDKSGSYQIILVVCVFCSLFMAGAVLSGYRRIKN